METACKHTLTKGGSAVHYIRMQNQESQENTICQRNGILIRMLCVASWSTACTTHTTSGTAVMRIEHCENVCIPIERANIFIYTHTCDVFVSISLFCDYIAYGDIHAEFMK